MKRRTIVKGVAASVTFAWPNLGWSQVAPRPLVPVWMGEDMARRMITLIEQHEDPEHKDAMVLVFEHAPSGANQPPPPPPPEEPDPM